ncbi:MFS multidrug transporter [Microthyrium microscopicum]|uniref:MFS multidrug transporter n=1 Tax=Microthyrium microscopicum TaxID=703497 RepID=A0A6A6U9I9_9PEZI|nr:MFS multidrug transporter [Microthyrium microscopicum]
MLRPDSTHVLVASERRIDSELLFFTHKSVNDSCGENHRYSSSNHLEVEVDLKELASCASDISSERNLDLEYVSYVHQSKKTSDRTMQMTWDSLDDPENPKNWTRAWKWTATPLSSSMAAPALSNISEELQINSAMHTNLVLSIFVLAYCFGPFVSSPCAEIWGRKHIVQYGNLAFLLFNTACGFARTETELIAFRFLAGLGGSATVGIGSAVLSDCWGAENRGQAMSIYQLAPVMGPALAPIVGGFIAQYTTWRWIFWSISIFSIVIQLIAFAALPETYAPRILQLKAQRLRQKLGNPYFRTELEDCTLRQLLGISLTRPWRLLATQPIIQVMALYQAFNFGMLYLIISSLPKLWEETYGMSKSMASLNYLALVGSLIGAQCCGPLTDAIHRRLRKRYGFGDGKGLPEFRIPLMVPATGISAAGIFIFGFSAQAKLHWIVPDIGIALFGGGSMVSYLCIQMYMVDTYTRYAASASAASAFLRSLAAFVFPLFAPYLFQRLHYDLGCAVLGSIAVGLGIPAPILLYFYGPRLRKCSSYAAGE